MQTNLWLASFNRQSESAVKFIAQGSEYSCFYLEEVLCLASPSLSQAVYITRDFLSFSVKLIKSSLLRQQPLWSNLSLHKVF